MMKRYKRKFINWINSSPLALSIFAFLILFIIIGYLDIKLLTIDFSNTLNNILVESNGLLFDLLVFGIILGFLNLAQEKRQKIERYKEEIDDYRRWDEKEAMYRISGNIRRLNKMGVTDVDLSFCFLQRSQLDDVNLENSNLFLAQLQKANMKNAILNGVELQAAFLQDADISEAKLVNANLYAAKLHDAMLFNTDFQGANLGKAKLCGAIISRVYSDSPFFTVDENGNLIEEEDKTYNYLQANFSGANLKDAVAFEDQKEDFTKAGVNVSEMIFISKDDECH